MKKFKTLPLTVEASDICICGDTTFWPEENDGMTAFLHYNDFHHDTTDYILLRNILQCIGEEYKVTKIVDWSDELGGTMAYFTNLPRSVYEEAEKSSPFSARNKDSIYDTQWWMNH